MKRGMVERRKAKGIVVGRVKKVIVEAGRMEVFNEKRMIFELPT